MKILPSPRRRSDVLRQLPARQHAGGGTRQTGPPGRSAAALHPIRTDERNVSYPKVFLNGISVCLDQQAASFASRGCSTGCGTRAGC